MKRIVFFAAIIAGLFVAYPSLVFATEKTTNVRVLHASPNAPAVDVYANGNKVLSNVHFGTLSSYLSVPAGMYRIEIRPAGQESPVVIDTHVRLSKNKWYTLAAAGTLETIQLRQFRDKHVNNEHGTPRVRVIHLSPDAPAVDVGIQGKKPFVRYLTFGEQSSYKRIPAGTYTAEVRVSGTDTTVLSIPDVVLNEGISATIYATGLAQGTPSLSAILAVDAQ
jgi:hypothetical protein